MRLFILTVLCAALASASARAQQPGADAMRVMSYNVNYGMAGDTSSTLRVIAKQDADIVLLHSALSSSNLLSTGFPPGGHW